MAHPKQEQVRQWFDYRCGYCGVSEVDSGGELTVDHYHPLAAGGDNSDANLVYACIRCNQYKRDYWPRAEEAEAGLRVLHPLRDDLSVHLRENKEGYLEGLTETGKFHIGTLALNRPLLVAHRRAKREARRQKMEAELLLTVIDLQDQAMAEMASYMARLRERLERQERG